MFPNDLGLFYTGSGNLNVLRANATHRFYYRWGRGEVSTTTFLDWLSVIFGQLQ